MNPGENLDPPSQPVLTFQQNQIFVKLLELDFDPDLCFTLLKIYPEDITFTDFLNRFISDENGSFNHIFIGSTETPHLCQICHGVQSTHEKSPLEEEEKLSKIYKTESSSSEDKKSQRSDEIKSMIFRSRIRVQCKICLEGVPDQYLLKINNVNHEICIDCLKSYITNEILRGKLFPLKCPHCHIPILDLSLIKQLVDKTTFVKYQRLMLNFALASRKDLLYCPGCFKVILISDCKTEKYLDYKSKNEKISLICPSSSCSVRICSICYREEHYPTVCELMAEKELKEFSLTTDVQRCINCQAYVEKIKGCNHMTCFCGYEFCWLCNGAYTVYHYNSGYYDANMICPFKRKTEDMLKLGEETTPKNIVNLINQSTRENIDLREKDMPALDSLNQVEFERKEKKQKNEKIKWCIFLIPCLPFMLIICPIYFFLKDVTMSAFWRKKLRKKNSFLKGTIMIFLFLIGLLFLPILCIFLVMKFCTNLKFRNEEPRSPLLLEDIP